MFQDIQTRKHGNNRQIENIGKDIKGNSKNMLIALDPKRPTYKMFKEIPKENSQEKRVTEILRRIAKENPSENA